MQENLCLRCRGLPGTDRLAKRSKSLSRRALLCLKPALWNLQDRSALAPALESGNMMGFPFFRLEFWGFAFLICLCLGWKQLSKSSVGIKQTDYKAGRMFLSTWVEQLEQRVKGCASPRTQFQLHVLCEGRFAEYLFLLWLQKAEYGIVFSLTVPLKHHLASVIQVGVLYFMNLPLMRFFFP